VADAVGPDAYVSRLAAEARKFTLARSELREGIDWILRLISWLLPPTIGLLIWSQVAADQSIADAIAGTVAGGVAAVPQGLVLLTSIAFAVGVIRLGRRSVLVRELPAVEGLARVDTVCFDKTGTLTSGRLELHAVEPLAEAGTELGEILGALGGAEPSPNATLRAVTEAHSPPTGWAAVEVVPFSSARKWSGAEFEGKGVFVLGAPEVLAGADRDLLRRAEQHASEGWRVLILARVPSLGDGSEPPGETTPLAMLVIGDQVRPEAEATLEYLAAQGVDAKVISGDHPRTVGAVASRVGMKDAGDVVDGRELPDDPEQLADIMERSHLFGRVTPQQKRAMIGALHRRGHVVAMTGDGVNDVLALKDSDLGIAMGSGTQTTRSVAQVVLLDGDFSTVPHILTEGRRVAANIERVANLFLTKTVYAFLIALAVAIVPIAFPFLPRHLTLIGSLTIGIPAFFLALEGTAPRARRGFIPRVMRFAVPTGAVAATSTFLAYLLSREEGVVLISGRTIATIVLGAVGVMALAMVCRPLNPLRRTILASVIAGFGIVFMVPAARDFFALEFPRPVIWLAAVGIIAITGVLLLIGLRASGWLAQASVRDLEPIANNIGRNVRDALDRLRGRD
jgi:cation-transporting ATPase E